MDSIRRLQRIVGRELRLQPEHQSAVRATYCWTGTLADRAATLHIGLDTLRNRTRAAIYRLDDLYHARKRSETRAAQSVGAPPSADVSEDSLTVRRIAQRPFYAAGIGSQEPGAPLVCPTQRNHGAA